MLKSPFTQSAMCVVLFIAGSAAPAFADPASQNPFIRMTLEVCPKVVKNGPTEIAAYVAGFEDMVVEPPVVSKPQSKVGNSFAVLLDVPANTPIIHVASRDPAKQKTLPFVAVARGSKRCVVMKSKGDATFAAMSKHFASDPRWSKVVDGEGTGVWVRYDENDQPQFTINLWFTPKDLGRTLNAQVLPLTPNQLLQMALDDRPRIVEAMLNECISAVADRRAPRQKAVSEFFAAPPASRAPNELRETHGRSAVLQFEPMHGESCLYTSNGGTFANRRVADLIQLDLEKRGAVPSAISASRGGMWWLLKAEGKAETRVTLNLDPTAQLLTMWIGGSASRPPASPPPPPALPPP